MTERNIHTEKIKKHRYMQIDAIDDELAKIKCSQDGSVIKIASLILRSMAELISWLELQI